MNARQVIAQQLSDDEVITGDGVSSPRTPKSGDVAVSVLAALADAGFHIVSPEDDGCEEWRLAALSLPRSASATLVQFIEESS